MCKFIFQYPVTLVNVFASTDTVTVIEVVVFSWQSMPRLYNKPSWRVTVFNVNGISRECCELSKQLQGLYIDVAMLSETCLKPHERFFISNYHIYRIDCFPGRKGIPHKYVDLSPLLSVEATRIRTPIDNSGILLSAVYKSLVMPGLMQPSLSS
jgi:hypothetical protein